MVKCIITQAEELLNNIGTEADKIQWFKDKDRMELVNLYESINYAVSIYKKQAPGVEIDG